MPSSKEPYQPRDQTCTSCLLHAIGFFTHWATCKTLSFLQWSEVKFFQSCLTLCDSMDYTVHGNLQARILEWVAFLFSRESSYPRDQTQVSLIAGRSFTSWATTLVMVVILKSMLSDMSIATPSSIDLYLHGISLSSPSLSVCMCP